MRVPDLQPLAAGASALLLIASLGWWALSAPELVDPGHPTWKGAEIEQLEAAVPEIEPFTAFYVNDDNPFVPYNLRLAERNSIERARLGPRTAQPPPKPPNVRPPLREAVVVVEPPKPKLVLPKLVPAGNDAPTCFGLVTVDGQEALLVRMPGASEPIRLTAGGAAGGWTLVSIDNGNLATFTDPAGIEQRFAIGEGNLTVAQDAGAGAGAAVPGQGKNPLKPGMGPKPPGTPADGARPGSQRGGIDGQIPKPEARPERRPRPPKQPAPIEPQPKK
jgi:hypothetical protein